MMREAREKSEEENVDMGAGRSQSSLLISRPNRMPCLSREL